MRREAKTDEAKVKSLPTFNNVINKKRGGSPDPLGRLKFFVILHTTNQRGQNKHAEMIALRAPNASESIPSRKSTKRRLASKSAASILIRPTGLANHRRAASDCAG